VQVIQGQFVGSFQHEVYMLGSTRADLAQIIQKMIKLRLMNSK